MSEKKCLIKIVLFFYILTNFGNRLANSSAYVGKGVIKINCLYQIVLGTCIFMYIVYTVCT